MSRPRPRALVTEASAGLGYALAMEAAARGYDLTVAAAEPDIVEAADAFRLHGGAVTPVFLDGSQADPLSNAGQDLDVFIGCIARRADLATPVLTKELLGAVTRGMRDAGRGRVLLAAAPEAGPAARSAIRALDYGWRDVLEEDGVSLTVLAPESGHGGGSRRLAALEVAAGGSAACPRGLAGLAFDAMLRGDHDAMLAAALRGPPGAALRG